MQLPAYPVSVITFRLAVEGDAPRLRQIAVAAYQLYVPRIGREPAPMTADYLAAARHGQAWVAAEEGEMAGFIILVTQPGYLLLDNLAVLPAAQGHGIGARLLAFAEERARSLGLPEIRLYTNEAMTENLSYYPRHGYTETHRAEQDGFHRVFFRKPIATCPPHLRHEQAFREVFASAFPGYLIMPSGLWAMLATAKEVEGWPGHAYREECPQRVWRRGCPVAVVISTPVRTGAQPGWVLTCAAGGADRRPPEQAGHWIDVTGNQEFLRAVLGGRGRFHYASRDKLCVVSAPLGGWRGAGARNAAAYQVATVSLGMQAIHQAFAAHVPLSLTPDFLWYLIVHEVAEYVRQNPREHAHIFTDTPDSKQVIVVRDDSLSRADPSGWRRSVDLVRGPLRAKISDYSLGLFLPQFSTTTEEAQTALLIALMDVVSPFYQFKWYTMCGIPQIRLEGDAADWRSLHFRADLLAREFGGLSGYFTGLLPVLQAIAETASGMAPDEEFWRSIYKHDDNSGGPFVTGWITAFFAYIQTQDGPKFKGQLGSRDPFDWRALTSSGGGGYLTNQFPSHVSTVPFVWDYIGTRYDMTFAAGVTGVDFDDDKFLAPRLGFAVAETPCP